MTQKMFSAALLALALSACSAANDPAAPVEPQSEGTAASTVAEPGAASTVQTTSPSSPAENSAMPVPPNPEPPIPRLYHGRWGLVPADCTSTAGDAKGLMTVGGETIRFYESLATVQEELVGPAGSYIGRFAVTGEGQSWEAIMRFTRSGDALTRSQDGTNFIYKRCS